MLLTGASRGIGHGTCQLFAAAGWRVITVSRTPFDTSSKCPWKAGGVNHVQADLSSPKDTERAISEIKRRLGGEPLHALVNNAAISPKNDAKQRLAVQETDLATWQRVMQVNFIAPIMLANGLLSELQVRNPV